MAAPSKYVLSGSPSMSEAVAAFGEESVNEVERLLRAGIVGAAPGAAAGVDDGGSTDIADGKVADFAEVLPQLGWLVAGALAQSMRRRRRSSSSTAPAISSEDDQSGSSVADQYSIDQLLDESADDLAGAHDDHGGELEYFSRNATAIMKAFYGLVRGPDQLLASTSWAMMTSPSVYHEYVTRNPAPTSSLEDFRQRLNSADVEEQLIPPKMTAAAGDVPALRFVAEHASTLRSPKEVARALASRQGREFVRTLSSSPTFASSVMYSALSWGDIWNWLKGAAQWLKDAAKWFGEEASKVANAVVEGVFSKFPGGTKLLEGIPGVGLVVAGIYYAAGKTDEGTAALAINLNAIVTTVATALGAAAAGPGGAMIGGALGTAAGLLLQEAMSKLIQDKTIRAEVGDVSATQFIMDVALSGAAAGGAGAVGNALAESAGVGAVKAFATSQTLSGLLAGLPRYLAKE